jgi:hypothetical protein
MRMDQSDAASEASPGRDHRRAWDFGPAYLLLAALVATIPGWLPQRALLPDPGSPDAFRQRIAAETGSFTALAAGQLAHGTVPLWNPSALLGEPLLANDQVGVFYPTILFHMFLEPRIAWACAAATIFWIAGLGAWWLARRCGLSAPACLAAGLVFMFCGANVYLINHAYSQTAALLPLALALMHRLLSSAEVVDMMLMQLVVACAILAGRADAAIAFLALVLLVVLIACLGLFGRAQLPNPRRFSGMGALIAALLMGILLSGVQWVTYLEYLRDWGTQAFRDGRALSARGESVLPLLGILTPWAVEALAAGGSVALAAVLLALRGILRGDTRSVPWLLLALVAGGLAASAWGERYAFQHLRLAWDFSPLLLAGLALALAMLAAVGLDGILARRHQSLSLERYHVVSLCAIACVVAICVLAGGCLLARQLTIGTASLADLQPTMVPLAIHAAAVIGFWAILGLRGSGRAWAALLAAESITAAIMVNPGAAAAAFQPTTAPSAIDVLAARNGALVPPRVLELLGWLSRAAERGLPADAEVSRLWSTSATAESSASLVRTHRLVADADAAFAAALSPESGPQQVVVEPLSSLPPELANLPYTANNPRQADPPYFHLDRSERTSNSGTGSPRIADVVEETPERIRVRINGGTGGWLVLARAFSPGWQARQIWSAAGGNERQLEPESLVYPAYGFLQGIPLPLSGPRSRGRGGGGGGMATSGPYDMVVEFAPRGFRHGRLVSLAGGVAFLLAGASLLFTSGSEYLHSREPREA